MGILAAMAFFATATTRPRAVATCLSMLSVRRPCASERSLVSVCLSMPCFLRGLCGCVRPTHPCNAMSCYRRDIFCFIRSSSTPIAIYHSLHVPTNEIQVAIRVGRTLCCKICVCLLWSTHIRMYIYTPLPWPVATVVDCLSTPQRRSTPCYKYKHPAAHLLQHLMQVVNESSRGEHNPEAYVEFRNCCGDPHPATRTMFSWKTPVKQLPR